jgi:hypothetical protein
MFPQPVDGVIEDDFDHPWDWPQFVKTCGLWTAVGDRSTDVLTSTSDIDVPAARLVRQVVGRVPGRPREEARLTWSAS